MFDTPTMKTHTQCLPRILPLPRSTARGEPAANNVWGTVKRSERSLTRRRK